MAELSEAKQRLLQQRLAAKTSGVGRGSEPIPTRPEGPVPLSPGQSALLYEHRLHPDRAGYNVCHAYRLRGEVDLDRFAQAVIAAVARHEPLRTSCAAPRRPLAVSEALHVVEVALDEAGFEALARREATTRFDLEQGPLVRATIVRIGEHDTGFVLAMHHVSSDAASLANLWRDLDASYHQRPLSTLACSYSDHAVWQAARRSDADRGFWRDHLGADPRAIELPVPSPAWPEPDGYQRAPLTVDPADLQRAGMRPVPFFLGLFAALLQRYDDRPDTVVGVTASTRDHPAVQPLVGYFLTVLPLRLEVEPGATVAALSAHTDAVLAAALTHRRVPYAEIAAGLRQRAAAQPDPARVLFVYDEPHRAHLAGLDIETRLIHNEVAVTDLTLFVRRGEDGGFEAAVEWDGHRYRAADMRALLDTFVALCEWAARHPSSPWAAWVPAGDLHGPAISRALEPLPALIAEQARRTPDAAALRCGDQRWSYAELDRRAATIGAALAAHGVCRGDRVVVCLPRGGDAVAALLGTGRVGAAFVPLDVAYPDSRLQRILDQADAKLVVSDAAHRARLGPGAVTLEELLGGGEHATVTEVVATLDDAAYVIFTSGSTGVPRGVSVRHRQLAASTLGRFDHYAAAVRAFLMVSSFGFDSSMVGLFWTLAGGGELVLPTEEQAHDVDALTELAEAAQVSHLLMVPVLYRALLQRDAHRLRSLRVAIVAGETCPAALVALHHRLLDDVLLSNEYGPTETTVWASAHDCRPGEDPVPIGRAAPGVIMRVADRWSRPRPSGTAGELLIGGGGLTDGYLGDDPRTAMTFVQDSASGERFYRSGDLVRLREDGAILFLGRIDHQLSVGGTRVEPEEIEMALAGLGATAALVRIERRLDDDPLDAISALDARTAAELLAVAARAAAPAEALAEALAHTAPGTDLLVAYVEGDDLDPVALSAGLAERLPKALVPAVIEVVGHLARTEHGKVDRSALGPPLRRRRELAPDIVDSSTVGVLIEGWRHVLGAERETAQHLDADSDFFANGGDSLLAVELVTHLEARLGHRVPISALVLGRTPRRLSALIAAPTLDLPAAHDERRSFVVPMRPHGERPPLVILPPGGGNLIVFDPFVQAFDARFPVLGFDLPGADRDDELPASVEALCDTYLPQLRQAQPHGPYRFLGWSFGGVVALELAQRLVAEGEQVDLVAMIDTLVPGLQRAGRSRVYLELAKDLDLVGIADKLRRMVQVRLMLKTAQIKGRRAAARGEPLTPTDRNTWLTIKVDEIVERYRPRPYGGRVLFFAARDTHAWRTTEPWRKLIANFDVVTVEGEHEGADGLLSAARVGPIAAEIAARLG